MWQETQIRRTLHPPALLPLLEVGMLSLEKELRRYQVTITPDKKGADVERYRIEKWRRHPLASQNMADVRREDIVAIRDEVVTRGSLQPACATISACGPTFIE